MAKDAGSLDRGRRLRDEVPPVPEAEALTEGDRQIQASLRRLVESVGGRFGVRGEQPVPVDHVDELATYVDRWARRYAQPEPTGLRYTGRPGIWHALDELYPLQDPNRWDRLRQVITDELVARGWQRRNPPRGSSWDLPV